MKRIELVLDEFGEIKVVPLSTKSYIAEKLLFYRYAKSRQIASYS
jgi:hypothetical protein